MSDIKKCCKISPTLKYAVYRPTIGDEHETYYYECARCHRSAIGGDAYQMGKFNIFGYLSPGDALTAWNDVMLKSALRERK